MTNLALRFRNLERLWLDLELASTQLGIESAQRRKRLAHSLVKTWLRDARQMLFRVTLRHPCTPERLCPSRIGDRSLPRREEPHAILTAVAHPLAYPSTEVQSIPMTR